MEYYMFSFIFQLFVQIIVCWGIAVCSIWRDRILNVAGCIRLYRQRKIWIRIFDCTLGKAPSIDHCGSPALRTFLVSELCWFQHTVFHLTIISNHFSEIPVIPYNCSFLIRMLWYEVSNILYSNKCMHIDIVRYRYIVVYVLQITHEGHP